MSKHNKPSLCINITWRTSAVLLSLFITSCISFKSKTTEVLFDATFEKYYVFHDVSLVNTDITKELIVNGKISAANSKLNKVSINGIGEIQNSVINEDVSINGRLTLNKTVVKKNVIGHGELIAVRSQIPRVDMEAEKITLDNAKVGSIRVRKFKNTTVYVRNGSVVAGNITFDMGDGKVFIDKQSSVKGTISSGLAEKDSIKVHVGKKY